MTKNIRLQKISEILENNLLQIVAGDLEKSAIGVNTDTRNLTTGAIFLALEGAQFDGHNFAKIAIEQGAIALIVSRQLALDSQVTQFIVADTLKAYQQIARWWRDRFKLAYPKLYSKLPQSMIMR